MGKIDEELKKQAKQKAKKIAKSILIKIAPILIGLLIVVIIAGGVFSIFSEIKERIVGFLSDVSTTLSKYWKHFIDDEWIKLDEEIEFNNTNTDTRTG